jgi:predicted ATPase
MRGRSGRRAGKQPGAPGSGLAQVAAPGPACQQLLGGLLRASPGLGVLATSREVLWIPGEQGYEVAPLRVPQPSGLHSPEAIAGYPGVALFARRAGEKRPQFTVTADNVDAVAHLCGLSEGLPLFLELAAAQLRSLSVQQLSARLDYRFRLLNQRSSAVPPRHQSLRAAVEWSFTLCSEAERLAWARASVFAGRFDLEAAEAICAGDGLSADEVLDALSGLINKSVLVCADRDGVRRYWMLATLRAYGLERLHALPVGDGAAAVEDRLRGRHRDYYLGLAERFDADWFGMRSNHRWPPPRCSITSCARWGSTPLRSRPASTTGRLYRTVIADRRILLLLDNAATAEQVRPLAVGQQPEPKVFDPASVRAVLL